MEKNFTTTKSSLILFDVGRPKEYKKLNPFTIFFFKRDRRNATERKIVETYKKLGSSPSSTDLKIFYSKLMLFSFLNIVFEEDNCDDLSIIEVVSGKKKLNLGENRLNPNFLRHFLIAEQDYHSISFPEYKNTGLAFDMAFINEEKEIFFKTLVPLIDIFQNNMGLGLKDENISRLLSLELFLGNQANKYSVKIKTLKDYTGTNLKQTLKGILEHYMSFFLSDSWFSLILTDLTIEEGSLVDTIINNIPEENVIANNYDNSIISNRKTNMEIARSPHYAPYCIATILIFDFLSIPHEKIATDESFMDRLDFLAKDCDYYYDEMKHHTKEAINPVDLFRICVFFAISYSDKSYRDMEEKILEHIDDIVHNVRNNSIEHIVNTAFAYKEHKANMSIPVCFDINFDNIEV